MMMMIIKLLKCLEIVQQCDDNCNVYCDESINDGCPNLNATFHPTEYPTPSPETDETPDDCES